VGHMHLKLMDKTDEVEDADGCRPDISIWTEEGVAVVGGRTVAIAIKSLWGQPSRYIDLTATEARKFAELLNKAAGDAF
jgi:hypothetical protein